jgi:hypothetical protein
VDVDEHSYREAMDAMARRRFGRILHLSGYATAAERDRATIDVHLSDIARVPQFIADRLVQAGLAGVFIGAGPIVELDNMAYLRDVQPLGWRASATYASVPAIYDREQRYVVAGTVGAEALNRHDFLHECGHAIGDLFGLNEAHQLRDRHTNANFWIRLPPYFRGRFAGDARGRREVFAELFRDRILDRDQAIALWGHDLIEWLGQELGLT